MKNCPVDCNWIKVFENRASLLFHQWAKLRKAIKAIKSTTELVERASEEHFFINYLNIDTVTIWRRTPLQSLFFFFFLLLFIFLPDKWTIMAHLKRIVIGLMVWTNFSFVLAHLASDEVKCSSWPKMSNDTPGLTLSDWFMAINKTHQLEVVVLVCTYAACYHIWLMPWSLNGWNLF